MIENFELNSQYYDLNYNDKKYEYESRYISKLIKKYNPKTKKILDVGCGTGRHAEFLHDFGFDVTGIDLSEKMIKIASDNSKKRGKDIKYKVSNANNFHIHQKFDTAVSLFHVISYQDENKKLIDTFRSIYNHLNDGGVFIFDFWYGPGVLKELPSSREKKFKNENLEINRKSSPNLIYSKNIVDVNFKINVKTKAKEFSFQENHRMRYFFEPELEFIANLEGFTLLNSLEWLKFKNPNENSWHALWILKKNKT